MADFYNAVIGHYEVPLNNPRRDREKGRVWRIVYTGEGAKPQEAVNLAKVEIPFLVSAMGSPNLTVRNQATNAIIDRFGTDAVAPVRRAIMSSKNNHQRACGLWVLERLKALDQKAITKFIDDRSPVTLTHLARCLAERRTWTDFESAAALSLLTDSHAMVRRAAADALGRHPSPDHVAALWETWQSADPQDTQLIHTVRIALRNHLAVDTVAADPQVAATVSAHPSEFLPIIMATGSDAGAELLVTLDTTKLADDAERLKIATFIAQRIAEPKLAGWITNLREHSQKNPLDSLTELSAIDEGLRARGSKLRRSCASGSPMSASPLSRRYPAINSAGWLDRSAE